jgi:hypothetical protein
VLSSLETILGIFIQSQNGKSEHIVGGYNLSLRPNIPSQKLLKDVANTWNMKIRTKFVII